MLGCISETSETTVYKYKGFQRAKDMCFYLTRVFFGRFLRSSWRKKMPAKKFVLKYWNSSRLGIVLCKTCLAFFPIVK